MQTNAGRMFRPDNPLLPNYKWVPIACITAGASSIVISGTPVRRPVGQTKAPDAAEPTFGPCRNFDYELETGMFISDPAIRSRHACFRSTKPPRISSDSVC